MVTGKTICVSMKKFSIETLEAIKNVEGVTSVVEVFPNHKEDALCCMLVAYTDHDAAGVTASINALDNIEYADPTSVRRLV